MTGTRCVLNTLTPCTGGGCCGNYDTSETACENRCYSQSSQSCNPCEWGGAECKATQGSGQCYAPEFMGIEFGEMEISTGIIALVAAILLPTLLFRKNWTKGI
tara:strand:- start:494 stop:802 length:309 start_codon:yes stop_codon:yes gene_type:complete